LESVDLIRPARLVQLDEIGKLHQSGRVGAGARVV
jgi:hypothetical protein